MSGKENKMSLVTARDLQLGREAHRVRLSYSSPACNVAGRDGVRGAREPAGHAGEHTLGRTVPVINEAAGRAGAAGIPGINEDQWDACQRCFVVNKPAQLCERPGGERRPLGLSNPYPRADALQVFQSDPTLRAFSRGDDLLADAVVHVLGKTRLLATTVLQYALRGLRPFGLKLRAQAAMAVAQTVHLRPGVDGSVRVGGDVDDTHVNAEEVSHVARFGFVYVAGGEKEPLSIDERQVRLSLLELKQGALPLSAHEGDGLAAGHSPDGDFGGRDLPTQDAGVIADSPVESKGALGAVIEFVGVRDLRLCANGDLRGQPKPLAGGVIAPVVERELAEGLVLPGPRGEPIAQGIRALQRLAERLRLFCGRQQLRLSHQFHNDSIPRAKQNVKRLAVTRSIA